MTGDSGKHPTSWGRYTILGTVKGSPVSGKAARPVQVSKQVYDGIMRAWAAPGANKYSIKSTAASCKRAGDTAALEWIQAHEFQYGQGVFQGFFVDEEYPGSPPSSEVR